MGITLQCVAFIRYALDGVGFPSIKTLGKKKKKNLILILFYGTGYISSTRIFDFSGRMLESGSEVCFLLLLLLIAKGYTVTRGRLRLASSVKLTIFMCAYVVTTLGLFIYEQHV